LKTYQNFFHQSNQSLKLKLEKLFRSENTHLALRINSKFFGYIFSFDIILSENDKVAETNEECTEGGYVFVNENKGL
jgi:hypothetical protein